MAVVSSEADFRARLVVTLLRLLLAELPLPIPPPPDLARAELMLWLVVAILLLAIIIAPLLVLVLLVLLLNFPLQETFLEPPLLSLGGSIAGLGPRLLLL